MLLCVIFLVFIVKSPALSSIVWDEPDDIFSNGLSTEGLSDRYKRQATTFGSTPQDGKCVLPPYPQHGSYTMGGNANALPGQTYSSVFLNVTCNPGFSLENAGDSLYCYDGFWSNMMPKCIRFCHLDDHDSVEYHCLLTGSVKGSRKCGSQVPTGTVVKPVCRAPNYYYSGILNYMKCIDGSWNYVAVCKPECGTITPEGIQLVIGGENAKRGELPWHAGIYSKDTIPYKQICGGSLVSTTTVISAAHCFWNDVSKLQPAEGYAVVVGKIYRPWNSPHDSDAQKSNVADIKVSPYFQGSATNFQDDIALVIVATPFVYQVFIRPVCVDFDINFDRQQLYDSNLGKVAGWGLVAKNGIASQILKVVELPYVNVRECYAMSPPSFRPFITNDKICAGYTNGTTLCQGDSGGGLAFPTTERGTQRYYLRGVVSAAPRNQDLCNAHTLTTFTHISKHEHFIEEFISVEGKCVLPPFPEGGSYTVRDNANASPGQEYSSAFLIIICNPGFGLEYERDSLSCHAGVWSGVMPKCIRHCHLDKDTSVDYRCPITGSAEDTRECGPQELTGTIVKPVCKANYYYPGNLTDMKCIDGNWNYIATCKPGFCHLNKHDSVEYRCLITGSEDSRECDPQEPIGTVVKPVCKAPNYFYSGNLTDMICVDSNWNYVAVCTLECGRTTPESTQLIGGKSEKRGELPWHAGIYTKTTTPYKHICGGSLISTTMVISAAQCFWDHSMNKLLPATDFAVAVGKIFRLWNDPNDSEAQKSDVAEIKVPSNFRASTTYYQDDIALVIVGTPFSYQMFVRPICVDFDLNFDKQLSGANFGKVTGWGLNVKNRSPSDDLEVLELPVVNENDCYTYSLPNFRAFLTNDKMCAGYRNGTVQCLADDGSGLAFPSTDETQRYYLRGVASNAHRNKNLCVAHSINYFTRIIKHEHFIKQFIL